MSDVKQMIEELVAAVGTPKYAYNCKEFTPGKDTVFYSGPYWDEKEVIAGVTAFLTGKWLVSGENVAKFQWAFCRKFNVSHAHMVNSGSSANLTMVAALKKHLGWKDGDQVIVSPVGFPTTIAPLVQNGLAPVFVDIEMDTLNFDLDHVEKWITDKTVAIFVSPVLGNPPDMDRIKAMCEKHGIRLIGDNCDSLGTKWDGKLLTDYYYAWTTSFYPAHHISTGEGGMVC
jgi:CDP-6-deoxy-D-xylo-4-hexulose-3-dehydrase